MNAFGNRLNVGGPLKRLSHYSRVWSSRSEKRCYATGDDLGLPISTIPERPRRRPKRIIIVRHCESAGNSDEGAYTSTPDWKIPLTDRGKRQAQVVGSKIRKIVGDDPVYFYVSPYERTLETCQAIIDHFPDSHIVGMREEPRIIEQQFGNLQDPETIQRAKRERWEYGSFFYRFPNGESGLDVYVRIASFISTMHRDFHDRKIMKNRQDMNMIIVTHGLSLRLFLMRWFLYTVRNFEETINPGNGGFVVMERKTDAQNNVWMDLAEESLEVVKFPKQPRHANLYLPHDSSRKDGKHLD